MEDSRNKGDKALDEVFMREALDEAVKASDIGEVPVGAVIVRQGEIIARAHNMVEAYKSSGAHAEMLAIDAAEAKLGAKWLTGCTLYVTLEPCSMCAGAMVLARIDRLVIGAMDPKNGASGSVFDITRSDSLNHRIDVTSGVLEADCAAALRDFFRELRGVTVDRTAKRQD
jgi:tRNA(adenine34) deaminase